MVQDGVDGVEAAVVGVVHLLRDGVPRTAGRLLQELLWRGSQVPVGPGAVDGLVERLTADPALHRLPDGRWASVAAVVDGRALATSPGPLGIVGGADLVLIGRRFPGWGRIPLATARGRGMAEVIEGRTFRVAVPLELAPSPSAELWVLRPGPEGIALSAAAVDPRAEEAVRRCARRLGRGDLPAAGDNPVDTQLALLAAEATLLRRGPGRLGRTRLIAARARRRAA